MKEGLKFFSVTVFASDEARLDGTIYAVGRQAKLFLPISAISHLSLIDENNLRSGYQVHFDINAISNPPFRIKSINPARLNYEDVELL